MKTINRIPGLIALVFLCLLASSSELTAQCPTNIGFEQGNFAGWTGYTGTTPTGGCCPISAPTPGIINGRHTIMTGAGWDPVVGAAIPVVAPFTGNTNSLRLGNSTSGAQADAIETQITVTPLNTAFIYWYAVVLYDPQHQPQHQPRFEIAMTDQNGNPITCGMYQVMAANNVPGFQQLGSVRYKTWSPVNQDLSAYMGQTITVRFSTGDCGLGGHYGYAYVDGLCDQFSLAGGICPGDTTLYLSAPGGFQTYLWTPGNGSTQNYSINNPTNGTVVSVQLTPFTGAGCVSTITDTINVTAAQIAADFVWPSKFCPNDTIQFTDSTFAASSNGVITSWDWNFGDPSTGSANTAAIQNPYHKFSSPGNYNVELIVETVFGCKDTIVKLVEVAPVATSNTIVSTNYNGQDISCNGASDGGINLTVTGAGPFNYSWTGPGGFTSSLEDPNGVAQGTYHVSILDTNNCVTYDSITLTDPPPVTASSSGTDVLCNGGTSGTASAIGGGGTPGLSYSWTPTGFTGANVSNMPAGSHTVTVTDANGCTSTSTLILSQPPAITSNVSMAPVSCFGGNDGSATVSNIAGGVGGFTWSWNSTPTQTTATASNLPAGPATVTVTDSNGCIHQNTVQIQQPQPITVNLNPNNALCFQDPSGSITSNSTGGTPPYTYLWSTGATTPNITGLLAGSYSVTVTDSKGCTGSAATTIQEPLPLTTTSWPVKQEDCNINGTGGEAATQPSGGTPPYTYVWSPSGQTTPIATGLTAGNYQVFITDANNCQVVDSVTITKQPSPIVIAGANQKFCEGEGGVGINATATGGAPPYYYVWWCDSSQTWCGLDSVHDNDPHANPGATTTYYVMAVDQNGCSSQVDSLIVEVMPKPIVDAGPDQYICADSAPGAILLASVTGAPGPFTYTWTPAAGLNDSTILNPYARPDTTTIYTLVVHSLGNGCTSDATTTDTLSTVTVHVQPMPIAIAHLPGPVIDVCLNDSVELQGFGYSAGPQYDYQWSPTAGLSDPNIANPYAFPQITTEYVLTVWSNGCPSYGDTVTVNVHTLPTVDAGPPAEICPGDIGQLDGEAWGDPTSVGYSFFWWPASGIVSSQSDENPMVTGISQTQFYVMATSSWGCESAVDSTTLYIKPVPLADAGGNLTACFGEPITLPGGVIPPNDPNYDPSQVFYSWSPSTGLSNPNIPNPTVTPTTPQTYTLTITYNTCQMEDELLLTVMPEIIAHADADTHVVCSGDSVKLYGWGGVSNPNFTWIGSGLSSSNSNQPMAAPGQSTVYQVVVEEGGCYDTTSVHVDVLPTPEIAALSSDLRGCVEFDVSFLETTADAYSWIWNFGDGSPLSNEQNPSHTYTAPGVYTVGLTATGIGNCVAEGQIASVTVVDVATAEYRSNPNYPVRASLPNSTIAFQDQSVNAVEWVWDFGDGSSSEQQHPTHTYTMPGEYMVTLYVTNSEGCVTEIVHGPYIIMPPDLFIPNVFSPNGDGNGDRFIVQYTGDQPFTVTITDRWGVTHWTSKDKTKGWDGRDLKGTDLSEGVYYYNVLIGEKNYAGNVTLMR